MVRVAKDSFHRLEQAYANLTEDRLKRAEVEMRETRTTSDPDISLLLRELSIFGHAQPLSNESRLLMRRKIQALDIRAGMPAIWITISPNDINNPVKMKLAIHRLHDYESAKELLADLREKYDRIALSTMDPVSSAIFFHREISLFFEKYVNTGRESIFGKISHYYATVETNERGSLHLHGLLWLDGNMRLPNLIDDMANPAEEAYRAQVIRYIDSVFHECLDEDAGKAVRQERKPIDPVEEVMTSTSALTAAFEDESNFIAYSCRFKAPWKIVEQTGFTEDGLLQIRRNHPLVNRYNKSLAVGLRHNHDVSMILTKTKGLAMVYYITNYATKLDTPMWKRIALATEVARQLREAGRPTSRAPGPALPDERHQAVLNESRQFLMRTANRIFSERQLSAVEDSDCEGWMQKLRRPDQYAVPIFQGYISDDHEDDHPVYIKRNSVLHLALFVPWENFTSESLGDITDIWTTHRAGLCPRLRFYVSNICLLRKSAEDARKDAKLWASRSEGDDTIDVEYPLDDGRYEEEPPAMAHRQAYRALQILRNAVRDTDATKDSPVLGGLIHDLCEENPAGEEQPLSNVKRISAKAQQLLHLRMLDDIEGGSQGTMLSADGADIDDTLARYGDTESPAALPGSDLNERGPRMLVDVSPATSFAEMGHTAAASFTLNYLQTMALQLVCLFLDKYTANPDSAGQHLQYTGGPGGTGKSRIIDALKDVFAARNQPHLLQITGTSGSSAAQIGGTTIHSACGLWHLFKTVVLLEDQVRARNDPQLRALLDRVRNGRQTHEDLSLLNANIVGRSQITFHDGLRAITPLNRTRWALNMEAVVGWARFNKRHIRIFVSTHTWRNGTLSPNLIARTIGQGDDSACKVPGVFFYAQGMPVVVNKNIYTGLKVVNGADFTAVDVIIDPNHPGYCLADDVTIHFGPPLGILLQSEETKTLAIPSLPVGTVLIRPMSHTLDSTNSLQVLIRKMHATWTARCTSVRSH
ncbi:ATP-dependent DNA helicase PIF1 [Hirsutella rhossiliensis]|uniref:ATP-dependent DNA helicase PIF1 n=1 Tax=Hirsutella rhossiliensis TaxID=111463 RepID=A0A9P8SCI2_9HYPO|nr:ATP-dependent DNA helicase PIF1 [Hirsutella rhossiliensis]KAH0956929.1 ATP-dependent DNA helicase PIF1 [Hirsutella rhossiliensis]